MEEANKSRVVIMMSEGEEGWPVCPSLTHWDGVSGTALLEGFGILGQIRLLQLLHVFTHQSKVEVKSLLFSVFSKPNSESDDDIQLSHKTCYKSVIVSQKPLKLHGNLRRPNFLFQKPSVEVRAHHRQEVLTFPQSLLSVRAQPRHKGRDALRWASASTRAALRKFTAYVSRSVINQPGF